MDYNSSSHPKIPLLPLTIFIFLQFLNISLASAIDVNGGPRTVVQELHQPQQLRQPQQLQQPRFQPQPLKPQPWSRPQPQPHFQPQPLQPQPQSQPQPQPQQAQLQQPQLTYHHGTILTGEIKLSILWFGNVKENQKTNVRNFIKSLNTDNATIGLAPRVTDWWRTVESYQLVLDKRLTTIPKIQVNLAREVNTYATSTKYDGLDIEDYNIAAVGGKQFYGKDNNSVAITIMADNTSWEYKCEKGCFSQTGFSQADLQGANKKQQLSIVVTNPVGECKAECGWPFYSAKNGPTNSLPPPSGDMAADLMVTHFAAGLAAVATNPWATGFYYGPNTTYGVDAATICKGRFGAGSFPGYTGKLLIDPRTRGGFNAHGINNAKFLLPAIFDPIKGSCWTTL